MYELFYSEETGKISFVRRMSDFASIPLDPDNTDFQQFLIWNDEQEVPLDLNSTIKPIPQEPVETLEEKITRIVKTEVAKEIAK